MASSHPDGLKKDNKWHSAVLIQLKSGFHLSASLDSAQKELGLELAEEEEGEIRYQEVFYNWNQGTPLFRTIKPE